MLRQLTISHYALIDHLDIQLGEGLNIITGETGSGKSIILGAMGLLMGERADSKAVQQGKSKCVVEGHFSNTDAGLNTLLRAHDLDEDVHTILRREVLASGKSRAFVNDTPVNLKLLKEIGMYLIDIHSQHHTLQINDAGYQLRVLDRYAGTKPEQEAYQEVYEAYRQARRAYEEAQEAATENARKLDFIEFQLRELQALKLDAIDGTALEEELNLLRNADEIAGGLGKAIQALSEAEPNALSMLHEARDAMASLAPLSMRYEDLHERLKSAGIELLDVARELEGLSANVEADPRRLDSLEALQASLYRMEQKHAVQGVDALREVRDNLEEKVRNTTHAEQYLDELKAAVEGTFDKVKAAALILRKARQKAIPQLQSGVLELLKMLNMPYASIEIRLEALEQATASGMDKASIYFSANAGQQPMALKEVASGGELSRLMLAIKCMASDRVGRSTIVFDEIDTGVSGEVAHSMGRIMKRMAAQMQVLSITHLPQVAAKGERHFKVYKEMVEGRTLTQISALNEEMRIEEIAQMLSGARTTKAALANAKELLGQE